MGNNPGGNNPGGNNPGGNNEEPEPRVVVRDRRRIDPQTGQVRSAAPGTAGADQRSAPPPAAPSAELAELAELRAQLDERTFDLQRVSAEFANYRRRVDRDRELVAAMARAQVAAELLGVLDDVDRAEQHGDLTGPFKAVADKLVAAVEKLGIEPFGTEGEPFDPSVHEAVQHATAMDVEGPTVSMVLRRGYRLGERLLRPAMVAVTDREPDGSPQAPDVQMSDAQIPDQQ